MMRGEGVPSNKLVSLVIIDADTYRLDTHLWNLEPG
jgi:hypothetical protein